MDYKLVSDENGYSHIDIPVTDYELITSPILNKGVAFTDEERNEFLLHGLLPPYVAKIEEQQKRAYESFQSKKTPLEKYVNLRDLQDSNETLFYHLVTKHVEELMPIIYTPTVGLGCQLYSHIFRRPRGVFISYPNRHKIDQILSIPRFDQIEAIVVSDGERILGLGDQGAGGMGIPVGKLSLYTACAGIHPRTTLPILLDTGTNNQQLLNDPLYIGWRHERIRGKEYEEFIDLFVAAVKKRFPNVMLQWEDFAQQNAGSILEKYRNQLCTFNDDIQGTAAVATGTLLAAIQVTKTPLKDQRVVIVGAGSAGCGISSLIKYAMVKEGVPEKEARGKFYLVDRAGLLLQDMDLLPFQKEFAQSNQSVAKWQRENKQMISLKDVVKNVHPTLLIGVAGVPRLFTEEIVREMASHVKQPIIFPLSNPTDRSEATPSDLMTWTDGRVIIGTGSPFGEIIKNGKPFRVDQTNNSYIFPGMGLGLIAVKAKGVTDSMFMIAAKTLAECSPAKTDPNANLLPPLANSRELSFQIAVAVATEAIQLNLAPKMGLEEIKRKVRSKIWEPIYLPLKKVKPELAFQGA